MTRETHTHTHFGTFASSMGVRVMVGRSIRRRALVVIAGLAAMTVGVVSPVVADEGVVATETGDALELAGSLVADPVPVSATGENFVAVVAGSEVELPSDPTDPLVLGSDRGEVSVELPGFAGLDEGVVDDSGAVVYESNEAPVSFAAQATEEGGMQVLVVIDGPDAPTEYRFDMTVPVGAELKSTADGGAAVVSADGSVLSTVASPWALDADGNAVPSEYRIDGTTLVQMVTHHGASYPVVADPRISFGWGVYVYMKGIEIKTLAVGIVAAGGVAVFVSCSAAALDELPIVGAVAKAAKLLCGWLGLSALTPILEGLVRIAKSSSFVQSACYEWKVPGNGNWKQVGSGNC